jgi:hypothetical protein
MKYPDTPSYRLGVFYVVIQYAVLEIEYPKA